MHNVILLVTEEADRQNRLLMTSVVAIVSVFFIAAAIWDWDWLFTARKFRIWDKLLGRDLTRWMMGILGVLGILFAIRS